jgi:ABC-type lipoprotein release transport system permease subunit
MLFAAVPVALLVTTLIAAALPARRAASIDPQRALRQD